MQNVISDLHFLSDRISEMKVPSGMATVNCVVSDMFIFIMRNCHKLVLNWQKHVQYVIPRPDSIEFLNKSILHETYQSSPVAVCIEVNNNQIKFVNM